MRARNTILESLHGALSRFVLTLLGGILVLGALYYYQNNREEASSLPVIRELSHTYQKFAAPLAQATFSYFYEIESSAADIFTADAYSGQEQLIVPSTWHKDSILHKLSFSKRKMRQARKYVEYIEQYKALALRDMHYHKVPASIKLAQALLESGAGQSRLATKTNNHFGIKARPGKTARAKIRSRNYAQLHNEEFIPVGPAVGAMRFTDDHSYDRFEVYQQVGDSYLRHTQLLTRPCREGRKGCYSWIWPEFSVGKDHDISRAANTFYAASGIKASSFFGETKLPYYAACAAGLKMAGYATSPTYHKKITYIIETYELWRFDLDLLRAVERSRT